MVAEAGGNPLSGGGGGSSYISGYPGCIAIKSATDQTPKVSTYSQLSDSYHYSGYIFTDTEMQAGVNDGNGKAKISRMF